MHSRARMRWLGLALVAVVVSGCATSASAVEKWGPFKGKVVDVETGQPIVGAVVLAIWIELVDALIQTNTRFYDAREAVTGPDGLFEIPRLKPPFFTFRIPEPEFKIFAPGYAEHRWVVTPLTGQALVDSTVIEMRPLKTREERLEALRRADSVSVPPDKRCLLTRAVNKERRRLGLQTEYPECPQ